LAAQRQARCCGCASPTLAVVAVGPRSAIMPSIRVRSLSPAKKSDKVCSDTGWSGSDSDDGDSDDGDSDDGDSDNTDSDNGDSDE